MRMKSILKQEVKLKDNEVMDFNFAQEDIDKGLNSTTDNPHYCKLKDYPNVLFELSAEGKNRDELSVKMYHSWHLFEEAESNESKN